MASRAGYRAFHSFAEAAFGSGSRARSWAFRLGAGAPSLAVIGILVQPPPLDERTLEGHTVSQASLSTYQANTLMEDRHALTTHDNKTIITVFDGHGGNQASEYAHLNLAPNFVKEMKHAADKNGIADVARASIRAFERTDREYIDAVRGAFRLGFGDINHVGSCALSAVLYDNVIIVANAGDCRAVLGTKADDGAVAALDLSNDHNARMPKEQARLAQAHPGESDIVRCKSATACYVKGRLQPTRALGDPYLKMSEFNGVSRAERWRGRHIPAPYTPPYITSTPEILVRKLEWKQGEETFLIMACDGLWDAMSSKEAAEFVAADDGDRDTVAARLVEHALRKEATSSHMTLEQLMSLPPGRQRRSRHDDMTVVVAYLRKPAPARIGQGGARDGTAAAGAIIAKKASSGWWSRLTGSRSSTGDAATATATKPSA